MFDTWTSALLEAKNAPDSTLLYALIAAFGTTALFTEDILQSYWLATHYDNTWYKAWHTWALANFDVVGYLESQTEGRSELPGEELAVHIVQAVDGKYSGEL